MTTAYTLQIREFGSAALFAMLIVSTLFFGFYIDRSWGEIGNMMPLGTRWRIFYGDVNKAAIGWFTTSLGATIKNGAALWVLHAQIEREQEVSAAVPVLYLVGTLLALWGMVCLMHALTRNGWCRGQWTVMILAALAFGAAFVLS